VAQRAVVAAEQRRDALYRERQSVFGEAGQRARDRFDAREVRAYYQYERHLARLIDEADSEIRRLRRVAEERRLELEEAMKRRRMVEKLCERRLAAFLAQLNKAEQKMTDENATGSAAAKRGRIRAAV